MLSGPPPEAAAGADPGKQAEPEGFVIDPTALGNAYGVWMKKANRELVATGWPVMPDELVDVLVVPAAARLAEKMAVWLGEHVGGSSDVADAALALAPGLEIATFRFIQRRRAKQAAEADAPSAPTTAAAPAPPPDAPAPRREEPARSDAPPATPESPFMVG